MLNTVTARAELSAFCTLSCILLTTNRFLIQIFIGEFVLSWVRARLLVTYLLLNRHLLSLNWIVLKSLNSKKAPAHWLRDAIRSARRRPTLLWVAFPCRRKRPSSCSYWNLATSENSTKLRSIGLLSTFGKVPESNILDHLYRQRHSWRLFADSQFSFTSPVGTVGALEFLLSVIGSALVKTKHYCLDVLLDIRRPFENAWWLAVLRVEFFRGSRKFAASRPQLLAGSLRSHSFLLLLCFLISDKSCVQNSIVTSVFVGISWLMIFLKP